MRILHLSYSDLRGGAAIGAYRLHSTLRSHGVQSDMLVMDRLSDDPHVHQIPDSKSVKNQIFANRQSADLRSLYREEDLAIRSFNLVGLNVAEKINEFDCDLVHFHWVAGNTIRLLDMPKISRPIVWKMPDMWPFSGAEHYIRQFDTARYRLGYDQTEAPENAAVDLDRLVWEIKRESYKDLRLTVTSPSRFLAKCAHESRLLSRFDAHVIPNPLPDQFLTCRTLTHQEKLNLRMRHNLPIVPKLAVFSAFAATETRKGYHHLDAALEHHLPAHLSPSEIAFVIIGSKEYARERVHGYEVFHVPRIDNPTEYIELLQCADALVCPSEMDSTAMVVQEANAVGIPSIVFDVGGMPEMVTHRKNGYIATPYEPSEIADGIAWAIRQASPSVVRQYAQATARMMHDNYQCASRYISVYEKAIRRYQANESFETGTLFDRPVEKVEPKPEPHTIYVIDPSVLDLSDSSHNAEVALAFSAAFAANGYKVVWLANENASVKNPFGETECIFPYTAYDKVRSSTDSRSGYSVREMPSFEDSSWPPEREIYDRMSAYFDGRETSFNDAIFVPMVDRIVFDALIAIFLKNRSLNFPKLFLNFMFEKGNFLTGGYPLDEMAHRLNALGGYRKWIFPCVETVAMAETLSNHFDVLPLVVRPPHLFSGDEAATFCGEAKAEVSEPIIRAYQEANIGGVGSSSEDNQHIEKKDGEIWIGSFGRGRRDKGWGRLPGIITTFNDQYDGSNVRFIVQKPRDMDGLGDELQQMQKIENVIILDEIIDNATLDAYCQNADIFLLPYDKAVYGNRGSAFVWRAVAMNKPLVVSRDTGLVDGLLSANGEAAGSDQELATAISDVIENLDLYSDQARIAARQYFEEIVRKNPIVYRAKRAGFNISAPRLVIARRDAAVDVESLVTDGAGGLVLVRINPSQTEQAHTRGVIAEFSWVVDFAAEAKPALPELIRAALRNVSFSDVVLMDGLGSVEGIASLFAGAASSSDLAACEDAGDGVNGLYPSHLPAVLVPSIAASLAMLGEDGASLVTRFIAARHLIGETDPIHSIRDVNRLLDRVEAHDVPLWGLMGFDEASVSQLKRFVSTALVPIDATLDIRNGKTGVSDHPIFPDARQINGKINAQISPYGANRGALAVVTGWLPDRRLADEFELVCDDCSKSTLFVDSTGRFSLLLRNEKLDDGFGFLVGVQNKGDAAGWLLDQYYILDADGVEAPALENQIVDSGLDLDGEGASVFDLLVVFTGEGEADLAANVTFEIAGNWLPSAFVSRGASWQHKVVVPVGLGMSGPLSVKSGAGLNWNPARAELLAPVSSTPIDPRLTSIQVREIGKIRSERPRSRFAKWQILLYDVVFGEAVFEEVRVQLVVHDSSPFLAMSGDKFLRTSVDGGKFGDAVRIFPHRQSVFEEGVQALPDSTRRLLQEIILSLPSLVSRAVSEPESGVALRRAAQELAMGLNISPIVGRTTS
ncbi:MAG: glycosyltransferase [Ruegeria sp.]